MVCQRCIQAVKQELRTKAIAFDAVQLGMVSLPVPLTDKQKEELAQGLHSLGFTLLTDKNNRQIEAIKNLIIEVVYYGKEVPATNFSNYLSQQLHQDYGQLSRLFSSVEGITIEK